MILGTYQPNLSEKGRVALPKKIRNEIPGNRLVLSIGFESCIFGFEEKAWEKTITPDISRPISDSEARKIRRQLCAQAVIVDLDSQGRFVIPPQLLTFAQIKNNLLVIGAGDHFELWDPALWGKYNQ